MKPYVLGIDIGGTNTVFGLVDARGKVIASSSIKTGKHSKFADYLDELYTEATRLIQANDAVDKVHGIGIGAPNANYYTGTIDDGVNLPWPSPIPLAQAVSEKFGIPTAVTNDANAAALGEMTYGAGELGHMIVKRNNGRLCGCGRTGCLEAYCSATGVARSAREFLEVRTEPSLLREIPIDQITSKDVYDAAMQGDQIAKDIFDYTGTILGEALADMMVFSSPQAFILFGGLAKSGDLLMNPLVEAMDRSMLSLFRGKPKVIMSELKEADAAVLGASALGWEAKPSIAQAAAIAAAAVPAAE